LEVWKFGSLQNCKWTDKFGSLEVCKIANGPISLEVWKFAKLFGGVDKFENLRCQSPIRLLTWVLESSILVFFSGDSSTSPCVPSAMLPSLLFNCLLTPELPVAGVGAAAAD
jgi:hypothetical protein